MISRDKYIEIMSRHYDELAGIFVNTVAEEIARQIVAKLSSMDRKAINSLKIEITNDSRTKQATKDLDQKYLETKTLALKTHTSFLLRNAKKPD